MTTKTASKRTANAETAPTQSKRVRESLLAMLAEAQHPLATVQLEAQHAIYGQYIYAQLTTMDKIGLVVRQAVVYPRDGRSVYWSLPHRSPRACGIPKCRAAGVRYIPSELEVVPIYGNHGQEVWRDVQEVAGTDGWVCTDPAHARRLLAQLWPLPSAAGGTSAQQPTDRNTQR